MSIDERDATELFQYDPFSPEALADPTRLYKQLRDHHRAYFLPQYDAWALSRFQDVWDVGADDVNFSIADGPVFDPTVLQTRNDGAPAPMARDARPMASFATQDPPVHGELRQAIGGPLRPGAAGRMEALVRELARKRLDALSGMKEFNLTVDYGGQVSAGVMCALTGIPVSEAARMLTLVNKGTSRTPPGPAADAGPSQLEMHALIREQVALRRAQGERDPSQIIDRMIESEIDGRKLDDDEITIQLTTIITGGAETVPKVVSRALYELWKRPDQLEAVCIDLEQSTKPLFEEAMRFGAPLQYVGRTLTRDAVIGGEPMKAGQRVFLLLPSANRDEREFDRPDDFVWDRPIERHLAFGHGIHFCIGVHIARLEGRVLLEEFLRRFPHYEIDESRLEMPPSDFQIGYTTVMATTGR